MNKIRRLLNLNCLTQKHTTDLLVIRIENCRCQREYHNLQEKGEGREGGREGERERGREGGREGGREREREGIQGNISSIEISYLPIRNRFNSFSIFKHSVYCFNCLSKTTH